MYRYIELVLVSASTCRTIIIIRSIYRRLVS